MDFKLLKTGEKRGNRNGEQMRKRRGRNCEEIFLNKKDGPEMVKSSEKGKRGHEMFKSY